MNKNNHALDQVRKINRRMVLDKIRERPISRAKLAEELGLTKPTVGSIVDELLEKKIVIPHGTQRQGKSGGRPSNLVTFNPESAYGIGVDIGGTKILILVTDLLGNIKSEHKIPSTSRIDELVAAIRIAMEETGLRDEDIFGMGVGVPGTVDPKGVVLRATRMGWTNYPLKEELEKHFAFPVRINNDVNCAALGERWKGSGRLAQDMVFVAIGTGIGAAIVCNGSIVTGAAYRAGEVCYLTDREDIRGKRFNQLGEIPVFERRVSGTALDGFCGIPGAELFSRYSAGPSEEERVCIEQFTMDLSILLANLTNILNPEVIILGGGVSDSLHVVIDQVIETVRSLTPIPVDIDLAQLGSRAGAIGAVVDALDRIEMI